MKLGFEMCKVLLVVCFSATTASQKQCTTAVGTPVTALLNASRNTGTANINVSVVVSAHEQQPVV